MVIRIKNLRLRTIIGVFDWEREHPQDIVVNAAIEFDGAPAAASDNLADAVDYKAIKQRIMREVEASRYQLLEKLTARIAQIILDDPKVLRATVEVDKPHALRFCDSVSVTHTAERSV